MHKKPIRPELLKIIVCPMCKKKMKLGRHELICSNCGNRYPIVKGIPYLLPPELLPPKYRKKIDPN